MIRRCFAFYRCSDSPGVLAAFWRRRGCRCRPSGALSDDGVDDSSIPQLGQRGIPERQSQAVGLNRVLVRPLGREGDHLLRENLATLRPEAIQSVLEEPAGRRIEGRSDVVAGPSPEGLSAPWGNTKPPARKSLEGCWRSYPATRCGSISGRRARRGASRDEHTAGAIRPAIRFPIPPFSGSPGGRTRDASDWGWGVDGEDPAIFVEALALSTAMPRE